MFFFHRWLSFCEFQVFKDLVVSFVEQSLQHRVAAGLCHHGTCPQPLQKQKTNLEALGHGLSDTGRVFTEDLRETNHQPVRFHHDMSARASILHSATSASRLRCLA